MTQLRFQVAVIGTDHMLITSREQLPPPVYEQVMEALSKWKEEGGFAVIPEAEIVTDHAAVVIEIDLVKAQEDWDERAHAVLRDSEDSSEQHPG